jgi:hypothetical protein
MALSTVAILLGVVMPVSAVPANGKVWTFTQPDGHQFQAVLRGDEFHAYHETPTGEILLQDPKSGSWHYARPHADGTLEDTNIVVGQSAPETAALNPEKVPYLRAVQNMVSQKMAERRIELGPARVPAHGSLKALILLANFSDTAPTFAQTDFSNLMNTPGYNLNGAHGSVRDYYLEVSYGALTIQTDVYGWFNLPNTKAHYGANDFSGNDVLPREMIQDTITAAEGTVNFAQYDSDGDGWVDFFGVIHQGQGEEQSGASPDCIWSHSWELAAPIDGQRSQTPALPHGAGDVLHDTFDDRRELP